MCKSCPEVQSTNINNSVHLEGSDRTEALSNVEETSPYGCWTNV